MKKHVALATSALAVLMAFTQAADAAVFDSGTVDFQYYAYGGAYNGGGSPATFSTPGSTNFFNYFDLTVAGNSITYTYLSDVTWSDSVASLASGGLYIDNGSLVSSVSGIGPFTSVTLSALSSLGTSGFGASNVTFNSGAAAVSWKNLTFHRGDTVILDVNSGAVPEPATWAMMLTGFGAIGYGMRRRRKVAVSFA